ncbi:MAG: hypothetical protein ABI334_08650 [Candidatus Dormiibacterota bacterium]
MGKRVEAYRAELRDLKEWEPYLKKHSGLPGPRANLELVEAVGDEADADRLWRLSASADEFLALCGTAGLGRVALMEPETVMKWLSELASDSRWRVRAGVAIALQRIGGENMPALLDAMATWSTQGPYEQRAAAAALCEPALLKDREHAVRVLEILDGITSSLATTVNRRHEAVRVLRQTLGYCWSVAAEAAPDNAVPYFEKWLGSTDKDVAWVMKSNLEKARMAGLRDQLRSTPAATRKTAARPKARPRAAPKAGKRARA